MKGTRNKHMIDFLFTIALLFVFAIAAIGVTLCATKIYTSVVESSSRNDDARIAISYITEKIHQNDASGDISLTQLSGSNTNLNSIEALKISSRVDGVDCDTYIYVYDGKLQEIFTSADFTPTAENGTVIVELQSLDIEKISDKVFRIQCTTDSGQNASTYVAVRSK